MGALGEPSHWPEVDVGLGVVVSGVGVLVGVVVWMFVGVRLNWLVIIRMTVWVGTLVEVGIAVFVAVMVPVGVISSSNR